MSANQKYVSLCYTNDGEIILFSRNKEKKTKKRLEQNQQVLLRVPPKGESGLCQQVDLSLLELIDYLIDGIEKM